MISILFFLLTATASARPPEGEPVIKIAIIDSGFTPRADSTIQPNFCDRGHRDFFLGEDDGSIPSDRGADPLHHGSAMVYIIAQELNQLPRNKYCLLIYRTNFSIKQSVQALQAAAEAGVSVVNFSSGGANGSLEEKDAVSQLLEQGTALVTSAGNEGVRIDAENPSFPGVYDPRIYTVGNYQGYLSNWGPQVNAVETGPLEQMWPLSTSAATAVVSAKLVQQKVLKKSRTLYSKFGDQYLRPRAEAFNREVEQVLKLKGLREVPELLQEILKDQRGHRQIRRPE